MRKYTKIKYICMATIATAISLLVSGNCLEGDQNLPGGLSIVYAQENGSLSSVTEEAQILPISDSGNYMLKSDGFYCLNEDGTSHSTSCVHYFDHFNIDGTVFNGYYYHDESGKFKAESEHLVFIPQSGLSEECVADGWVEGIYMAGNLGRLSSVQRVAFVDNEEINKIKLNGCYYFDKNGRLVTEGGIYYIENLKLDQQEFDGYYYFDEKTGVLSGEGTTPLGLKTDTNGKIQELTKPGMKNLKTALENVTKDLEGEWSIFVKDLDSGESVSINNKSMPSASLIKTFTMMASYGDMEKIRQREGLLLKADPASDKVSNKLYRLMENMITFSDNESFNEMVRLQTDSGDFNAGAREIDRYLRAQGYKETAVVHTLAPSATDPVGISDNNTTSVEDCGRLLEAIYRGECVSKEASGQMLSFLLAQDKRTKIPAGLPTNIQVANKTGENDLCQHDIAIVYGEKTDYILCVMSENAGKEADVLPHIQEISALTYYALN